MNLGTLTSLVRTAAREELLPRFTNVKCGIKADGSFLTEADLAVQNRIAEELKNHCPETLFLGEEMAAEEQQALLQSGKPIWILDPLDGTSNYASGIPVYSVSLALIEQGELKMGIVYDPERDECFSAVKGEGAWLNDERLGPIDTGLTLKQCTGLVDFKRLAPALATRLATEIPYSSQRSFGSVALDWCWIAIGRSHVYLHGKQNLWDYAAGHLILAEAGGWSCTLDGDDVFNNSLTPRSAVAALDRRLFKAWVEWLGIDRK
ncbi:inositol monophosphatase family protein [Thiohalophilus thiocyanatoxydans]|uniref:Myo-inositol-1(Or 4)-monophosphatase n=1 Tax=Thiohalophilus thiocyanatoxydans TaxID=381308 RepID=A0A4R8IVB1_9GAMM|nr:inositol monophosphatase [Thiohalophilus thiocyanatoxydans]TDY01629.1 myo-inositol-1(or 4)-monophosphatase [Thiohalophilus thiocyanatoxydans]